jgi:transketolase
MTKHNSQRGWFAYELFQAMDKNPDIYVLTGDLGFAMLDNIKEAFPDRFINCGASEYAMVGIACGLAHEGKIPFVYSITTFLLYRAFEMLRTYVNYEQIPVRLIGSGRDHDYAHDGYSHWSNDAPEILKTLPNIKTYWPQTKEEIPNIVDRMVSINEPSFISLQR